VPTWLRTVFGVLAGAANLFANGTAWQQVLLSVIMAGFGLVTHLSSTSNAASPTGKTTTRTEQF
jgi:hypothetical protein